MRDRKIDSLTITAKDLLVQYGNIPALRIDELAVEGQIIAIIGHNGSGKSTLIKSILELLSPRNGTIAAVARTSDESFKLIPERDMAFSQENGGIFGDISVEEYLKLWCRIKHRDAKVYRTKHQDLLDELEIEPLLKKLGRQLSKGQRHRVQAAAGFLIDPALFLFDEPFDGLDIGQSIQLAQVMQRRSQRMAMILSSHRMEVVERLADQVIVLQEGAIRAMGTVRQVCEAISGVTLSVRCSAGSPAADTSSFAQNQVLTSMREEFRDCLVQQIGDQLAVTGTSVNEASVVEFLQARKFGDIVVQPIAPSLVDAMQFHLNSLG